MSKRYRVRKVLKPEHEMFGPRMVKDRDGSRLWWLNTCVCGYNTGLRVSEKVALLKGAEHVYAETVKKQIYPENL